MAATKTRTTVLNKIIAWLTANNNHDITGPQVKEITTDMIDVNCPSTALDGEISVFKKDSSGIRIQTAPEMKYDVANKRFYTGQIRASKDILYTPEITGLTGGGNTNLDGIPTDGVSPSLTGAIISFFYQDQLQTYQLQAYKGSGSVPNIIRPVDWSGSHKVAWIRILVHSGSDHDELRLTTNDVGSELHLSEGLLYYNNTLNFISWPPGNVTGESDGVYIFSIDSTGQPWYSAFTGFPFTDIGAGKYYIALFTMNTGVISNITDIRYLNNVSHPQKHGIDSMDNHWGVTSAADNNILTFENGLPKDSGIKHSTTIPLASDTGAANAIVATFTPAIKLSDNPLVAIKIVNTVTIPNPTCNSNGTGVKTICTTNGGIIMPGTDMQAGGIYLLRYDNAAGYYKLLNPSPSQWQKASFVHDGNVSVNSTTNRLLLEALKAKEYAVEMFVYLRENFADGAGPITAVTITIQNGSSTMTAAVSIFTGAGDASGNKPFAITAYKTDMVNAWNLNALFTSTGANLNTLTTGECEIYWRKMIVNC